MSDWKPGPRAALIVVDVQRAFSDAEFWGRRNNPSCESNIAALVEHWRATGRPMVFVRHDSENTASPLHPSNSGNAFAEFLTGEPDLLVSKRVNSAFHGSPDLQQWLDEHRIEQIVVCGITTNHCCETTARVGGNLGYDVAFALDATYTFDRAAPDGTTVDADLLAHITATNLHGEFATVVTAADLLA